MATTNTGKGYAYNQGVKLARTAGDNGHKAHHLTRTQMDVLVIDAVLWLDHKVRREEVSTVDDLYAAFVEGFTDEFGDVYGGTTTHAP